MDPDEVFDSLAAEQEGSPSPAPPRMERARRMVMDPIRVEGSADGTGTVSGGGGGRIVEGDEYDASQPLPKAPLQQEALSTADMESGRRFEQTQQRIAAAQEAAAHSPWWDTVQLFNPLSGQRGMDAGRRTRERVSQWWDEFTSGDARLGGRNPIAPIVGEDLRSEAPARGAASTLGFGMADEGAGLVARATGGDYVQARDASRARARMAQAQAPNAFATGQVAGTIPLMMLPGAGAASRTAGLGARAALAFGQGATLSGAEAFGNSDADLLAEDGPEVMRLATDVVPAAALGGVLMAGGELASSAIRGIARGPSMSSQSADEALLAATGHAGNNAESLRAFERGTSDEAIRASRQEAARVLREANAVPAAGTLRGVREGLTRLRERATGTMDDVRTVTGSRGPTGAEIGERLRGLARDDRTVGGARRREILMDLADKYAGVEDEVGNIVRVDPMARAPDEAIPYDELMEEIQRYRQSGSFRTRAGNEIPMAEEAMRDLDRTLREAYDDVIEAQAARARTPGMRAGGADLTPEQIAAAERLGMDPVEAYRRARKQYSVAESGLDNVRRGERALVGNRQLGPSEFFGGSIGSSIGMGAGAPFGPVGVGAGGFAGAALGGLAANRWRMVEPRVRATVAQTLYDVARLYPRQLTERIPADAARQIIEAAGRGQAAFGTTLHVLAQRDARVRDLFDQMQREQEEQQ